MLFRSKLNNQSLLNLRVLNPQLLHLQLTKFAAAKSTLTSSSAHRKAVKDSLCCHNPRAVATGLPIGSCLSRPCLPSSCLPSSCLPRLVISLFLALSTHLSNKPGLICSIITAGSYHESTWTQVFAGYSSPETSSVVA